MKVNVIGAGISGMMSAYYLAKKGHEVIVYERNNNVAMECSFANGGQISVCNSETWNEWETIGKGIKWLFKKDAPLLIRPYPSFRKLAWMAGFLKHTLLGRGYHNTQQTIEMGMKSVQLYDEVVSEEGIKFDQLKLGMMHVFTQQSDLSHAALMQETYRAKKVDWQMLSPEEVRMKDPALKCFKALIGGAFVKTDSSGDIHKFCQEMYFILRDKYGVKFVFNTEVTSAKDLDGAVVYANGHDIYNNAKQHGDWFNIYPIKGYSVTINLEDEASRVAAPVIPLLDNNKKIVTSTLGNRLRVAGTAELADVNYDIRMDRVKPLLNWVHDNFPDVNTHSYSPWACLRPMNSNMMPIVQKSKRDDNVYYHGGHGHLGWTLSAYTGKQLADLI